MNNKKPFRICQNDFSTQDLKDEMRITAAGGFVLFEGWVRDHNAGRDVVSLEYEAFEPLAIKEGVRIIEEAREKFAIKEALCIHRCGHLPLGGLAVWLGVTAKHRGPAFEACQYIIDHLKVRVPIWKNEHYTDGSSGWVECHECAKKSPSLQHSKNCSHE